MCKFTSVIPLGIHNRERLVKRCYGPSPKAFVIIHITSCLQQKIEHTIECLKTYLYSNVHILESAGFISIQDIGRERHCMLKQQGFKELQKWIAYFDTFWDSRLKKLESILNDKLKN